MKCRGCQQDNPPGQKFCGDCGERLGALCTACGAPITQGQNFCGDCGNPVAPTAAARPVRSARHLHASASRGAHSHLEERARGRAQAGHRAVRRHEGIDGTARRPRSRGGPAAARPRAQAHDGGGPSLRGHGQPGDGRRDDGAVRRARRHEDHAVRACYAALAMQEAVRRYARGDARDHGAPVSIRVGINSGEVIVRSDRERPPHGLHGHRARPTHLAARMEQLRRAGAILADRADTLRLAEGFVAGRGRWGRSRSRGSPQPDEVFELIGAGAGAHSPPGGRRARAQPASSGAPTS